MPEPVVTAALIGGAAQGLGMLGQNRRTRKAHEQNLQYMDLQHQNQQQLNMQGHQLGLDMWNATNYEAQVEHMKKAGLNPALMYGQAGQGGQVSSPSGGNAASAQAPAPQPMDMQNMLIGAQAAKLIAETKEIEKGTEGIELDNAYKVIENSKLEEKLQTEINEMLSRIDVNNKDKRLKEIAIKLKENGIHNDFIATLIGAVTGWDLTEENALDKEVEVIPEGLKTLLAELDIEVEGKASRRTIMNVAISAYIAGKIALDALENVASALHKLN